MDVLAQERCGYRLLGETGPCGMPVEMDGAVLRHVYRAVDGLHLPETDKTGQQRDRAYAGPRWTADSMMSAGEAERLAEWAAEELADVPWQCCCGSEFGSEWERDEHVSAVGCALIITSR